MQHLKRNWKVFTVTFVAVVCSAGVLWLTGLNTTASAQIDPGTDGGDPDFTVITVVQRDATFSVLADVSLDREALVALNLSAEQATDILAATRTWLETNASEIAQLKEIIADKRDVVRQLEQSVRAGSAVSGQDQALVAARADLAAALRAYDTALNGIRTALAAELSESQRSTWATIENGWGREMPVRMLALTSGQRRDYGKALRQHELRVAAATTAQELAALQTAWQAALSSIFTDQNRQIIDAYFSYANEARQNVDNAVEDVLPTNDAAA